MRNLLLVGDFGVGNVGDDAVLATWLAWLPKLFPAAKVNILAPSAFDPPAGVSLVVAWTNWKEAFRQIADADAVVIGGGGLFHEWWALSRKSFLTAAAGGPTAYLSIAAAAKALGKPCSLLGVGVGPLVSSEGKELVGEVLGEVDLLTLRDTHSFQTLRALGVPAERCWVTADTVFFMPQSWPSYDHLWNQVLGFAPPAPRVVVALRGWDVFEESDDFALRIAHALHHLQERTGASLLFASFQRDQGHPLFNDSAASYQVLRLLPHLKRAFFLPHCDPFLTDAIIAHSQLVIGMRFHAAVFALRSLVPVIGLAYDTKVRALFLDAGLAPWCLPLSSWQPGELADLAARLIAYPDLQRDRQLLYRNYAQQSLGQQLVQLRCALTEARRAFQLSGVVEVWSNRLKELFPCLEAL